MKDMLRGRKEDMMYQNIFHIAPNQNFVIKVGSSHSNVMYFDENGLIHNADESTATASTAYFLGMLICGFANIVSAPAHFTKEEIERANMLVQVFGETAKIRKVMETSFVVIGENNSSFINGSYFPSMEVGEVVWLSMISNYKG